ncbi:hypothetical protein GCM10010151_03140 [Actinoallomurus spadix]|uniref:Uncharacterized protein n=1 Tax=Actinoallomurus spadix TaxID=79912 RepID=A0ABP3FJG1_9ACTN
MEGAEALERAAAGVAELDVLPHNSVDRRPFAYEGDVFIADPACHVGSLVPASDTAGRTGHPRRIR